MAISEYFCDPSLGADQGDGLTIATAFGSTGSCLQYALDNITRNGTDGDRLVLLDRATETLTAAIDLSTYDNASGLPSTTAPLFFEGRHYVDSTTATTANYETGEGMAVVDLNNGAYGFTANGIIANYSGLDIRNGTGSALIIPGASCLISKCYLSDTSSLGILTNNNNIRIVKCYFSNCGDNAVWGIGTGTRVLGCYIKSRATDSRTSMTSALQMSTAAANCVLSGNTISVDGATKGILFSDIGNVCEKNSILSTSGTVAGITVPDVCTGNIVIDNLVAGFNGTGGVGIAYGANTSAAAILGNNALYNCSTPTSGSPSLAAVRLADIALTETPFAKLGSDIFANRANYFAPRNTGGIQTGAFL